jgi:hypothetical protein
MKRTVAFDYLKYIKFCDIVQQKWSAIFKFSLFTPLFGGEGEANSID